jgi:hypothetical protein
MMRVGCTLSMLLRSVSGGSSAPHSPNRRPQRPCVLLLISDDLRPQLDAAGYSTDGAPVTTPRLKQLASESIVFMRAYVQEALCAPSRKSFLSGRRPDTTRAWQFRDSFREAAAAGGGSEFRRTCCCRLGFRGPIAVSPVLSPQCSAAVTHRPKCHQRRSLLYAGNCRCRDLI